jgi:hypothetical protein
MANRILAGMFLLLSSMFCAAVAVARAHHKKER